MTLQEVAWFMLARLFLWSLLGVFVVMKNDPFLRMIWEYTGLIMMGFGVLWIAVKIMYPPPVERDDEEPTPRPLPQARSLPKK
jgi:hypothetical protein